MHLAVVRSCVAVFAKNKWISGQVASRGVSHLDATNQSPENKSVLPFLTSFLGVRVTKESRHAASQSTVYLVASFVYLFSTRLMFVSGSLSLFEEDLPL